MRSVHRDVERAMRTVFRRCLECEKVPLTCPAQCLGSVSKTLDCIMESESCDACARMICVPKSSIDNSGANDISDKAGPNVGAIAGGVIGGVVVIVVAVFLVWRFCIKGRQQEYDENDWDNTDVTAEKRQSEFTMRRDARMSTHTIASMASTVLTRASNVIQIAYIPGITNGRSNPQSPDFLVPPVPPIPIALNSSTPSSPYSSHEDQHYFMPGDLHSIRDSTYSGFSDDNRSSFHTRASITPSLARSSVATTIYRNDAVVNPMPAQTVLRGKAAVVSVKSGGSGGSPLATPSPSTPAVPSIDYGSSSRQPIPRRMPSNASSIQSNGQGSIVSTATSTKVIPVSLTKKKPSIISMKSSSSLGSSVASPPLTNKSSFISDSDSESRALLNTRDSNVTEIADTPSMNQSPFSDMSATITSPDYHPRSLSRLGGLDTVTEADDEHNRGETIARSRSPFGDEHEVR